MARTETSRGSTLVSLLGSEAWNVPSPWFNSPLECFSRRPRASAVAGGLRASSNQGHRGGDRRRGAPGDAGGFAGRGGSLVHRSGVLRLRGLAPADPATELGRANRGLAAPSAVTDEGRAPRGR